MNKIELIENLIESTEKISFSNKEDFDELERRAKMIISKIFGNDSHYISDLEKIKYRYTGIWVSGMNIDEMKYFQKGLKQFRSVLNVMLEDINLSSNVDEIKKPKEKEKAKTESSPMEIIKVIIASPSDVPIARELLLDKLETKFRRDGYEEKCGKRIVVDGWENLASQNGYAQDIVNEKLLEKSDIILSVFKHKIGTPTINIEDETERAPSGTAEELLYSINKSEGKNRPLGMAYFCNKAPVISLDSVDFDDISNQWKRLKKFKKEIGNKILYKGYNAEEEILELVCPDLCQNIIDYFK